MEGDLDHEISRRATLAAVGGGLTATAGCLGGLGGGSGDGGDGGPSDDGPGNGDGGGGPSAWQTTPLTDVRSGEEFTIADLQTPVLLQTFAVWCSKCLRQQRAIQTLLGQDVGVTPVNLNIDPNEDADKVRSHLQQEGFDWRYAVSPTAVTDSLVDSFGSSITVPPKSPVIVVCGDRTDRLSDGVKSADQLASALADCPSA